jgi:hypothetical protein
MVPLGKGDEMQVVSAGRGTNDAPGAGLGLGKDVLQKSRQIRGRQARAYEEVVECRKQGRAANSGQ